eukprot:3431442-Rhodomonas_salina.1
MPGSDGQACPGPRSGVFAGEPDESKLVPSITETRSSGERSWLGSNRLGPSIGGSEIAWFGLCVLDSHADNRSMRCRCTGRPSSIPYQHTAASRKIEEAYQGYDNVDTV